MKRSSLSHFLPWIEKTLGHSVGSFLDHVEELIHTAPEDAVEVAELLTGLVPLIADPDKRARALCVAASAFTTAKRFDRSKVHLDEAATVATSPIAKAEIHARWAHYFFHRRDWVKLCEAVRLGLGYLGESTSPQADDIRSRLRAQAAIPALYLDRDPKASARHSLAAMLNPAASESTHTTALHNLTSALGILDPRIAQNFLGRVYQWRQKTEAGRPDYHLAWIDGLLRARNADDKETRRAARRRLLWAAEGLFDVGWRDEATVALMDLLTLGYQNRARGPAADLARRILTTIQDDPTFADEVRVAASIYLESRGYARALHLRDVVVEHVHPGLFPLGRRQSNR